MMAEPQKHKTKNSKGPTAGKEAQARVDKATVVLALAEEPGDFGPCLTDEELALFASEEGSRKETDRWLRHAGLCTTCRDQWLLVRQSLEQGQERGKLYRLSTFRSVQALRSVGLALAAAACVAVYLNIVEAPGPMQENLPAGQRQTVESGPPAPPATAVIVEEKKEVPVPPREATPLKEATDKADKADKARKEPPPKNKAKKETATPPPGPTPQSVAPAAPAARVTSPAPLAEPAPGRQAKAPESPYKGVETQPLQEEALTNRDSVEKNEVSRKSAGEVTPPEEAADAMATDEVAQWLSALRRACEDHQADVQVWENLIRRGEGLSRVSGRDAEPYLATVLSLVRGIDSSDDARAQCPRILAIIRGQVSTLDK